MSRTRPHHRAPQQLILVALVQVMRSLSAATVLGFLAATVLLKDPELLMGAGIGFGCLVLSTWIHLAEASKIRCPVCTTALFARTGCSKHRTAQRILGSYRLHTATEILTRPLFHCHHCGEGVLRRATPEGRASSRRKSRRRVSKTLARVPIERLPERTATGPSPSPMPSGSRMPSGSKEPTLPS